MLGREGTADDLPDPAGSLYRYECADSRPERIDAAHPSEVDEENRIPSPESTGNGPARSREDRKQRGDLGNLQRNADRYTPDPGKKWDYPEPEVPAIYVPRQKAKLRSRSDVTTLLSSAVPGIDGFGQGGKGWYPGPENPGSEQSGLLRNPSPDAAA